MTSPHLSGLGSGTAIVSGSNLVARTVGFVASFAAAAVLAPDSLGAFAFMASTAAVVGSFGTLGFAPLTTRAVANSADHERARAVASEVVTICAGLLVALGAVLLVIAHPAVGILFLPEIENGGALLVVVVWALAAGLNPLLLAIVTGHSDFRACAMLTVVRALLVGAATVVGCLVADEAVGPAAGAAAGELLTLAYGAIVLRRRDWIGSRAGGDGHARALRSGAAAAGLASVAIQGAMWFGQFALVHSPNGLVGNALFLLASRLLLVVTLVPNALATAALPLLAGAAQSSVGRAADRRRVLVTAAVSTIPACGAMALFAPPALSLLDPAYSRYAGTVAIMALAGLMVAANNVLSSIAVAERRVRAWVLSDVVLAVVLGGSALWLVPARGVEGLASGYLLAYALSAVTLLGRRSTWSPPPPLRDRRLADPGEA